MKRNSLPRLSGVTLRHSTIQRLLCVMVAMTFMSVLGCAGDKKKTNIVRGKITFNGKDVPNGTITFFPESGPTATGEIKPDGSYTLTTFQNGDGAVEGNYTVVVVAMQNQVGRLPEERTPLPPPIVPEKYTSAATSDLRAEVKAGENVINFDLESPKK